MKRILVSTILLATLLTLMIPSPALASRVDLPARGTAFLGTAQVAVVNPGTVSSKTIGSSIIIQNTIGEMVAGKVISSKSWPELVGADILIIHKSDTLLNLKTNKITGTARGTILIGRIKADYSGMAEVWMQGDYSALIRGSISFNGSGTPVIYDKIFDAAKFSLNGVGYGFEGISASGTGFAQLKWTEISPGVITLAGPMVLTGLYK
jgi:hypothetical protein